MRRLVWAALAASIVACPGGDDDDIDLPPAVFDDDDSADDDDGNDLLVCGAPDAAPAFISGHAAELSDALEVPEARALGWAIDVAAFDFQGFVADSLELTVLAFTDESCPTRTVSTVRPELDPECVAEGSHHSVATGTYDGGCVGVCDFDVAGAVEFSLERSRCARADGSRAVERIKRVQAETYDVGTLTRHLGGISRFGYGGTLEHRLRSSVDAEGVVDRREEWTVESTLIAIPGPPKGFLSDLFRLGSGDATYAGSADMRVAPDGAVQSLTRASAGALTTSGITAPVRAIWDLQWDATVCATEPVAGDVTALRFDREGAEIARARVEFDGAAACDGCGQVYSGEAAVGSFCSAPPPSPPASLD